MSKYQRVTIPVGELEFVEGGNTIWVHSSKTGGTVLRIKTHGKITTETCSSNPNAHADLVINDDIHFCLASDARKSDLNPSPLEFVAEARLLYVCGTAFYWELYSDNGGDVQFYTSPEALKRNTECWRECGIVEVQAKLMRTVLPRAEPATVVEFARETARGRVHTSAAERMDNFRKAEKVYIALGKHLAEIAREEGGEHASAALSWATGIVKRQDFEAMIRQERARRGVRAIAKEYGLSERKVREICKKENGK